jgi:hypothetical protein
MDRTNHYEAAFEGYLQADRLCYLAVDETRRCHLGEITLKNLDFIVHGESGNHLLVDIKGRRFPHGKAARRVWRSWCEREDIEGLSHWEALFGPGFDALLVFAYHLAAQVEMPEETVDLWTWHGHRYLFRAVLVRDYRRHMRTISPKWDTVDVPVAAFRDLVRPLHDFTHGPVLAGDECPF